jgi:hypothetical protein
MLSNVTRSYAKDKYGPIKRLGTLEIWKKIVILRDSIQTESASNVVDRGTTLNNSRVQRYQLFVHRVSRTYRSSTHLAGTTLFNLFLFSLFLLVLILIIVETKHALHYFNTWKALSYALIPFLILCFLSAMGLGKYMSHGSPS